MKRIPLFLASLIILLGAFFAWHTPLRGPLTDAEIEAFIANQPETGGSVWTDDAAFEAFLRNDDGRPFVMMNLMELREIAVYPEGEGPAGTVTGAEADVQYGSSVEPQLLLRGSYPLARATRHETVINSMGETVADFDTVALVRYRSRRDLIDMLSSDAFLGAEVHKWASLENTLVAPSDQEMAFGFIGYIPAFLIGGIGVVVGNAIGRRSKGGYRLWLLGFVLGAKVSKRRCNWAAKCLPFPPSIHPSGNFFLTVFELLRRFFSKKGTAHFWI